MKFKERIQKRFNIWLMAFTLALSLSILNCISARAIKTTDFKDLNQRAWYFPYIDACVARGWLSGKGNSLFDPDGELKRGDLCLILYRMDGSHKAYTSLPFTDIKEDSYYFEALCWAYAGGFIKGYEDRTFRGEDSITRQDLLTILYRYWLSKEPISAYADFSVYEDADLMGDYAVAPLAWGINKNAIGANKKLEPTKTANRAETAKILVQTSPNPLPKLMRVEINNQIFYARLQNNAAAKELYNRAPFAKWMKEYEGREKYCYIQSALPTVPTKTEKISAGDLVLQNDNALVLFYTDYSSSYRYTPLAHIDEVERLKNTVKSDNLVVSFYQ